MRTDAYTNFQFKLTQIQLLGLTIATAIAYILYSHMSDGFYQHDEAAHFLNMRRFWFDHSLILGNWAKPGYKVLLAPFSLLGINALVVVNSLIAASTCYLAYRLSESINSKIPLFAFILLAVQPFWIQLSFRNYSEIITSFLLVSSLLGHYKKKYWLAALILSYTTTIRQEMYPFVALYGVFLVHRKNWVPIILLLVFPLLNNFVGWFYNGDPFYLFNSIVGTSNNIGDAYPRLGFAHYFKMSLVVFGGISLTSLLVYFYQSLIEKRKVHWLILIPILIFFLIHVIFSMKSLNFGPATGGNLRYLIVIAPLVSVLGGIALERIMLTSGLGLNKKLAYFLLPFSWIVLVFMTFEHNNVRYLYARDYLIFLPVASIVLLVLISLKPQKFVYGVIISGLISVPLLVNPLEITEEDNLVKEVVKWGKETKIEEYPILVSHTMFYYWSNKVEEEFENGVDRITEESVEKAESGTIIIWDTHYSYRPKLRKGTLELDYFRSQTNKFELIKGPNSTSDGVFTMYVFKKE